MVTRTEQRFGGEPGACVPLAADKTGVGQPEPLGRRHHVSFSRTHPTQADGIAQSLLVRRHLLTP